MSDYEYEIITQEGRRVGVISTLPCKRRRPPLTVEVTRDPLGYGCAVVTFIRPATTTSYEVSRPSYDRLVRLANSGEYVVEILDSGYGVGWQMRRKATP